MANGVCHLYNGFMIDHENTIRAFTALSVSEEIVSKVAARLDPLREKLSDLNIRWVPIANYHITLCFIGNIPVSDADKIVEVMAEVSKNIEPFDVKVGSLCLFPDHEKGGVLIADVTLDEPLITLQKKMNGALLDAGYDIYQRPVFRPHMTVARLKKNKIPPELLKADDQILINPVKAVHLYKSWKVDGGVKNAIVRSHSLN